MSILLLLLLWIKKSFVSDAEVSCVLPASMWQVNLLTCKVGKKHLSLTIALGLQLTVLDGLRIPGTGEPGGLPSMGSHRVGHD